MTDQTGLPTSRDVVVVGGGVVGMFLANELANRGADTVVIDRDRLAGGSTSRHAGGVRQQFFHETNIEAAKATMALLERLEERGYDLGLKHVGYLLLYSTDEQQHRLAEGARLQNSLGVPTSLVDVGEIREIAPDLDLTGVRGGCYGPTDGCLDTGHLAESLRDWTLEGPADVLEGVTVRRLEERSSAGVDVVTGAGTISTGVAVNAAGVWAPELAQTYGGTLPITARRSQVFVMDDVPPLAAGFPHTFDCDAQVYVRTNGGAVWSGASYKPLVEGRPHELETSWEEADELQRRVARRVPALRDETFTSAWAGLIEVTADDNPIVGWAETDSIYHACGFSGHGICIGPGLAASMAAEIVGEEPEIPLDIFRAGRFDTDDPLHHEGLWLGERPSRLEEWATPV